MPIRLLIVGLALVVAACGAAPSETVAPSPTAPPTPTPTQTPRAVATPAPSPVASLDPFAGQPYRVTLPPGWMSYDVADAATQATLGAFVMANPILGDAADIYGDPEIRIAVNPLFGTTLMIVNTPSPGVPLDTVAASLTTQLRAAAGLVNKPTAKKIELPVGNAYSWIVKASSTVSQKTVVAEEHVYLIANQFEIEILVFVVAGGGVIADESAILNSFAFKYPGA